MTLKLSRLLLIMHLLLFMGAVLLLAGCTILNNPQAKLSLANLYKVGMNAYQQGFLQQAKVDWQRGLALTKNYGLQNQLQVRFRNGLARIAESSGDYQLAVRLASQSLQLEEQGLERKLAGQAHLIKGQALWRMGSYRQASNHLELARQTARELGDSSLESGSVRTLGALYQAQGQYNKAEEYILNALSLSLQADDQWMQAKALNNLGGLYRRKGQYQEALDYYSQALQLRIKLNDQAGQGKVLGNFCLLYQNLNDQDQALANCQRALKISRDIKDKAREANHLNNLAYLYRSIGELDKAKKYLFKSVVIKRQLPDPYGEAHALNNIAEIYRVEGQYEDALEYFSYSLAIKIRLDDISGQSAIYCNMGMVYSDLGQNDQALENLHYCLVLQKQLNEPDVLWRVYDKLSQVYEKNNDLDAGIFFAKHAVNTIQKIRSNIQTLEKQLQKSYLQNKRFVYEQLAGLLIDQGRLLETQQVLDMFKEEEYFDFIRRRSGNDPRTTKAAFTKKELDWETRYLEISSDLVAKGLEYQNIKQAEKLQQTAEGQDRIKVLDEYLKKVRKGLREFLKELKQGLKHEDKLYEFVEKDLGKLRQYQDILGKSENNTVLIHYLLTDDRVRIILTSKNQSIPSILEDTLINRSELNQLILTFRNKIAQRQDTLEEAEALYDYLISPIEADLERLEADTLVIFPDQTLRYLPFSVLHSKKAYLIEHFSLAVYNSAAETYMLVEKPRVNWRVAGFGVSKSLDTEFKDLPAVYEEIDAIVLESSLDDNATPDLKGVLPGRSYIDFDFTSEKLEQATQQDYQIIHLATHFNFQPGSWEDSFLLTGNGERMSLEEFHDGDYQFAGVDLVTLSACETALNEIDSDGIEVEGLGTLLQRQGAYAVLATLWKVEDRSTAMFMEKFYQFKLKNLGKAEALRQTQLWFIKLNQNTEDREVERGVIRLRGETSHQQFSHPYYWAPFILMGNWL